MTAIIAAVVAILALSGCSAAGLRGDQRSAPLTTTAASPSRDYNAPSFFPGECSFTVRFEGESLADITPADTAAEAYPGVDVSGGGNNVTVSCEGSPIIVMYRGKGTALDANSSSGGGGRVSVVAGRPAVRLGAYDIELRKPYPESAADDPHTYDLYLRPVVVPTRPTFTTEPCGKAC